MKRFFSRAASFFKSPVFLRALMALGCGLIAVGALPPYYGLICLPVAFSGLFFLLNRTASGKQAFALGYAFGFGFFSLGLSWVSNALLTEGMGFAGLAPLPTLGFGIWGGFFPAAACLTAFYARGRFRRLTAFAAAWTLFEWVRAWLFTGFPWNLIASVWTAQPEMLQTASLWGGYGLSLLTVFTAALPALIFRRPGVSDVPASFLKKYGSNLAALLLFVLIPAALAFYGGRRLETAPSETDTIRGMLIRLVQANVPQGRKWNADEAEQILMKHVHLSRAAGAEKLTHVVWPETATQFLLAQDEFARAMAVNALKPGAVLMVGSLRTEPTPGRMPPFRLYNSILVFDDAGVLIGQYDKSHLVPFGEYAPLRSVFPFMKKFTPGMYDFSAGTGARTITPPRLLPVGMLVCYEAIFPGEVADKINRPYWFLNVTNDGWYGISAGPYQHFAAAQMRAVEEGVPLVRAANTGISGVVDAYGRVTASLPLGIRGFLDVGLPRRTEKPTLYGTYGNKIPLGIALILLVFSCLPFSGKTKGANT